MLSYYNEVEKAVESASEIYEGAEFLYNNITTIVIIGAILLAVIIIMLWNLHKRINEIQNEIITVQQQINQLQNELLNKK